MQMELSPSNEIISSAEHEQRLRTVAYDVGSILLQRSLPFRIWSGTQAAAIGGHRQSQDVDMWMPDHAILPAYAHLCRQLAHPVSLEDLDDRTIIAVGKNREVEIMACMDIHTDDGVFPLRFTKRVLHQSTPPQAYGNHWPLPFAPPEDTMLLKAILQRGEEVGKHDSEDITAMVQGLGWVHEAYLWRRLEESGASERALPYLRTHGVLETHAYAPAL